MKNININLTPKSEEEATEIIKLLSEYDCDLTINRTEVAQRYTFNFNEISFNKLGERVGRSPDEYKKDLEYFEHISDLLARFGLSPNHKGFRFAIESIRLINTYGMDEFNMNNDIYPIISKWYGVSTSSVEHNIRNAIASAWEKMEETPSKQKNGLSVFNTKPTNIRFLKYVARLTNYSFIDAYNS